MTFKAFVKNVIGILLFYISTTLMVWAMDWITEKSTQSEIIEFMQVWSKNYYDCPSPHPIMVASNRKAQA